ncbi:MAG: HAMP domain-containing histidine kinase [Clostridia bacterium]|nr:HAMP domain-containing histidine kinase [Clostridia bacterium]
MREITRLSDDKRTRRQMRGVIILFSFGLIVFSQAAATVLQYLLFHVGIIRHPSLTFVQSALLVGGVSVIVGTLLSWFFGRYVLRPFDALLRGMSGLSVGKYGIRLRERRGMYLRAYKTFNALAAELQSVEILRSDFINNFSHEFKTPLVSMQGLVSLMQHKQLPEEKKKEYLSIIEEELSRLSMMTTNVLNMTKLESQGILTNVTRFNLSEQLRTCILLLEKAWGDKKLSLSIDMEEVMIDANEDFLKQVWLNLLDNAIKYSPIGATIGLSLSLAENSVVVSVSNEGEEIPEAEREKIFTKFYQVASSAKKSGNGIGLSVVKRIVMLHGGSVAALREGDRTVLRIVLPTA